MSLPFHPCSWVARIEFPDKPYFVLSDGNDCLHLINPLSPLGDRRFWASSHLFESFKGETVEYNGRKNYPLCLLRKRRWWEFWEPLPYVHLPCRR